MPESIKDENLNSEEKSENKEEVEETTETEKSEKNDDPKEDKQETDYRPKGKSDTVPLSKYTKVKAKLKELKDQLKDKSNLNNEDLESFAEENNLDKATLVKIASIIEKNTLKKAEAKIAPILAEKRKEQNEKNFDKVFKEKTLKKYPHLADRKDQFKRMVMSPDFVDMSEEQIINEYFPLPNKAVKEDSPEKGSDGTSKDTETIDFAKMTEEQHQRVLDDPKLRAKYFDWQDKQG